MNPYYCSDQPPSLLQHANLDSILANMAQESSMISATPTAVAEAIDSWNQSHFRGSNSNGTSSNHLHSSFASHTDPYLAMGTNQSLGGTIPSAPPPPMTQEANEYVRNLFDHSFVCDRQGRPVTVARMLATKPLACDLQTRPGPGGKKLVYLSGDTVTRLLNEIFGHAGWNLQIIKTEQVLCVNTKAPPANASSNENQSKAAPPVAPSNNVAPMWHVAYLSHVRITLCRSGSFREDLGAGDAMDRNLGTAIQHAIKASITDAMKRAARHLGDKLGNSLYQGTFRVANAPKTLLDALDATTGDPKKPQQQQHQTMPNKSTAVTAPLLVAPVPLPPQQNNSTAGSTALSTSGPLAPSSISSAPQKAGHGPIPVVNAGAVSSTKHNLSSGSRASAPPMTATEVLHKAMLLQPPIPPIPTNPEASASHPTLPTHRPRTSTGRRKSITPPPPLIAETTKTEAPPGKKSKMSNPYSS